MSGFDGRSAIEGTAQMRGMAMTVWPAVRPVGRYQRVLWWCGTLMLVSAAVHAVIAVVDGGSWWGPVSWRKPILFGESFGLLLWSLVWILRQLPERWWVRIPAGLVAVSSVLELCLITGQRWRGVASHFNQATPLDDGIWSAIGTLTLPLVLGILLLLIGALVSFRGSAVARIAVVAGLAGVLVAGWIGRDMAEMGEAAFDATGQVPADVLFGAAGSAKLAHAVGLHALQVLAVLAVALEGRRLPGRVAVTAILVATAGYAAAFAAVTATAYAGRAPYAPTVPMALLLVGGALAVGVVAAVAIKRDAD